jgi:hypothetical protein
MADTASLPSPSLQSPRKPSGEFGGVARPVDEMSDEPSIDYPFEEFLDDFAGLQETERLTEPSFEDNLARVIGYMWARHGETDVARAKAVRFAMILMFLSEHMSDFDLGGHGVDRSEDSSSLLSVYVLRAVHELFIRDELRRDPSPEHVLHLAREFRQRREEMEGKDEQ